MNKVIRSKKDHYDEYVKLWEENGDEPATREHFDNYTRRWLRSTHNEVVEGIERIKDKDGKIRSESVWYFYEPDKGNEIQ